MKRAAIGINIGGPPQNDPRSEPRWAKIDDMRRPAFEHPVIQKDAPDPREFVFPGMDKAAILRANAAGMGELT